VRSRLLNLATVVVVSSCTEDGPSTPPPPPPPAIASFTVTADMIVTGAISVLSWSVAEADTVRIDQGIGVVSGTVLQVAPTATTTYTLTAVNGGGTSTAAVNVSVAPAATPPPDPANFVARTMGGGGGLLLSWSAVPMASSYSLEVSSTYPPQLFTPLTIVNGAAFYTSDGAAVANNVYTYRLTAVNAAGSSGGVTASAVAAPQPPEGPPPVHITPTSPVTVPRGGMVTFAADQIVTWTVLDGLGGGVIAGGVYTAPAGGGTFHIAAVGPVTNTATVIVP
jgi:hypothetical protein